MARAEIDRTPRTGGLLAFLERNARAARSESAWAIHKVVFGRWLVFCWHESIGAKYWVVKKYQDGVDLGQKHLEAGIRRANQS